MSYNDKTTFTQAAATVNMFRSLCFFAELILFVILQKKDIKFETTQYAQC